jgi:acetate---CoA ligase (ADP-forming)
MTHRSPSDDAPEHLPAPDRSMQRLLAPSAIAVVGASPHPDKIGHVLLRNLADFPGRVEPVHPTATEVLGRRAYPTVAAIPDPVDLALLAIPPEATPKALRDCVDARVGAAVIYSGGWAETGEAGKRLQDELRAIAREGGVRLLGPNTSGFIAPERGIFATFVADLPQVVSPGSLAIVAQSGGVNLSLCFQAQSEGLGVRLGIGLGNAADVSFPDILNWLAHDKGTAVVALAIEGVEDGRALVAAVERLSARRPVVALALGRADVSEFARSHTGALTGSYRLKRAALAQAGAVVVDNLTELVDAASALGAVRLPPLADAGVGVVTGQAGPGLLLMDALLARGLKVPPLSDGARARLRELLPPLTYQQNPVDTGRPTAAFGDVLRTVMQSPGIDVLAVSLLHEPNAVDPEAALKGSGPAVLQSQGPAAAYTELRSRMRRQGVALLPTPDRAAVAVAALAQDARGRFRRADAARDEDKAAITRYRPTGPWDEACAKGLLGELGIRSPERVVCSTRSEARTALARLGAPLAVKLLRAGVSHKTELGGVHLNVSTLAQLESALDAIGKIEGARYLLEKMVPDGPELLAAARRDVVFGPIVVLGSGGVAADLEDDVAIRLAPVGAAQTRWMLSELASAARYRGFRGAPAVDEIELGGVLSRLGDLIVARKDIELVEINPLRVTIKGLCALDAVVAGS